MVMEPLFSPGADTYTGATTITNGTNGGTAVTLAAGASNSLSVKSAFTDNSILNLQGFNQSIGSLAGSGTVQLGSTTAALLTVGSNNTSTSFTGLISGTGTGGGLTKIGTGTFTLNKANGDTDLGPTTVTTGTLAAGAANSFAPNSDFTVNATLNLAGFAQVIGSLSGTGTVSLGAATDGILSSRQQRQLDDILRHHQRHRHGWRADQNRHGNFDAGDHRRPSLQRPYRGQHWYARRGAHPTRCCRLPAHLRSLRPAP